MRITSTPGSFSAFSSAAAKPESRSGFIAFSRSGLFRRISAMPSETVIFTASLILLLLNNAPGFPRRPRQTTRGHESDLRRHAQRFLDGFRHLRRQMVRERYARHRLNLDWQRRIGPLSPQPDPILAAELVVAVDESGNHRRKDINAAHHHHIVTASDDLKAKPGSAADTRPGPRNANDVARAKPHQRLAQLVEVGQHKLARDVRRYGKR